MSRRLRAGGFLALAALSAILAATIADGYGDRLARGYGALRPVVVAVRELPAGEAIGATLAARLAVRRVPARFAPAGALRRPEEALGLEARAPVPAGSYLVGAQLRPPRRRRPTPLGFGRQPVELTVSGAAALLAGGPLGDARVDVVVTSEPTATAAGRTYVAASSVPLLALTPLPGERGPGAPAAATLGLTRRQALRLIDAESFAGRITLLRRASR